MAMILDREFEVGCGIAEQEIAKVIASERVGESESSLRLARQVLDLLIQRPTGAKS